MRNKMESKKSQSGQILIYTTILVMLAALILVPLMSFTYSSHRSAQIREERTLELYASDAGIEDALYQIKTEKKGTALEGLGFGEDSSYDVGAPDMNDRDVNVSVQKVWLPEDLPGNLKTDAPVNSMTPSLDTDKSDILVVVGMIRTVQAIAASDDFSSGWPGSGSGNWTGSWVTTGSVTVNSTEGCDGNSLKLADVPSTATRTANLLKYMYPQLKFSAKASSFEPGDAVDLKVKYGDSDWETPVTWEDGNESSGCNAFDVDLYDLYGWGGNDTSVPLQIKYDGNLSIVTVAQDNFDAGTSPYWNGNPTGWSGNWQPSGSASVIATDGPRSAPRHLRLVGAYSSSSRGSVYRRIANISDYSGSQLLLQVYAKRNSWSSSGDNAYVEMRSNERGWTIIDTWVRSELTTSYQLMPITLPYTATATWYEIRFRANMNGSSEILYIDDVIITDGDALYVDNLWIGDEYNSNMINIAYIDANLGNAYLDRVGVWMPYGCHYVGVVGDQTTVELNHEPTTILPDTYAGGTILEWDYGNVALHQPPVVMPKEKTLTFAYKVDVTQTVEGMFTWIAADSDNTNPPGQGGDTLDNYISWDKGYEVYKAVSQAYSQILGSNTQVTAYVAQGEVNKRNAVSYGNYVAIGNTLLKDNNGDTDHVRESANTPSYFTVSSIPNDAEVKAAWLYWSAFRRDQAVADTLIDFLYPKEYGPETFEVQDRDGDDLYTAYAYTAFSEPMVTLPEELTATLSPERYCDEPLGQAYAGVGNDTFFTDYKPVLQSPQARVQIDPVLLVEGVDYTLDYATGNVTIINDALFGAVTINYSVAGSQPLVGGTDYVLTLNSGLVTVINDCLAGNVTIDYWASHWSHNDTVQITHAAYDRYGTSLPAVVYDNDGQGWSYVCFRDVTDIVKGSGNGNYGVTGVYAIAGDEHEHYSHGASWPEWCYSGWSLVIIYDSPQETAHQFYLYDPIHNNGVCPFYSGMNTEIPFNLTDFYPPDGLASGRLTYFVGEGDVNYSGDKIKFKGDSQLPSEFQYLSGFYNPVSNIMNSQSSNGEQGVDIDTFDVTHSVGADTTANIVFETDTDSWNLVYIVLSFKTNMVPKQDYSFNVASVTYQYELGN